MNLRAHRTASPFVLHLKDAMGRHMRRALRPARFGTLRSTTPLSPVHGYDRGLPIDRHYIEAFLRAHCTEIRGRVLEIRDDRYTKRFATRVTHGDVLDVDPSNSAATLLGDLCNLSAVPSETFDCAIVTQTLQYVRDPSAALSELRRILKPGGSLLLTVPSAPPVDQGSATPDLWRFTVPGLQKLLARPFPDHHVLPFGNALTLVASIMGVAREELEEGELLVHDPRFPVLVGAFAVRDPMSIQRSIFPPRGMGQS